MARDIEQNISEAEERWEQVVLEPQGREAWGMYTYGDAPPAIGGGQGAVIWFESKDQLLGFVREVLPYAPPGQSDLDWDKVADETAQIVDQMKEGAVPLEEGVQALNRALVTFSQIEWLGTYAELCAGSHHFARKTRSDLREHQDLPPSDKPISDSEEASFRDYLRDTAWI